MLVELYSLFEFIMSLTYLKESLLSEFWHNILDETSIIVLRADNLIFHHAIVELKKEKMITNMSITQLHI